jgi:hypothetical protein
MLNIDNRNDEWYLVILFKNNGKYDIFSRQGTIEAAQNTLANLKAISSWPYSIIKETTTVVFEFIS